MELTTGRRWILIVLGVLALTGIVAVVSLAIFGTERTLMYSVLDDGFYFLTLARSMAAGHGPTFDGLGPTNGFHPLWAALLTPLFLVEYGSPFTPVRIMIGLALVIHLVTSWTIYRAARRLGDDFTAVAVALLYLANPVALYLVISGMESPLVALMVALLAGEAIALARGHTSLADRGTVIRLGLFCGLAMLARTDLVILAGVTLAVALLPATEAERLKLGGRLRGAVGAGLVAVAILVPWLAWNLLRFGSLVQVSARAHKLISTSRWAAGSEDGVARQLTTGTTFVQKFVQTMSARTQLPQGLLVAVLVVAVALVGWWLFSVLSRHESRHHLSRGLRWLAAPALYTVVFLAATVFLLGHIRSWYIAGPLVVITLLLALPIHLLVGRETLTVNGRLVSGFLLAGIAAVWFLPGAVLSTEIRLNARRDHCWQEAATWVRANTQPGVRVASFNSGAFGYLTENTVVNLDCVVNNRALPYLQRGELLSFIAENSIAYIIDDPRYVRQYMRFFGDPDWRDVIAPIDTLPSGLIVYAVGAEK